MNYALNYESKRESRFWGEVLIWDLRFTCKHECKISVLMNINTKAKETRWGNRFPSHVCGNDAVGRVPGISNPGVDVDPDGALDSGRRICGV